MKHKIIYTTAIAGLLLASCGGGDSHENVPDSDSTVVVEKSGAFEYVAESFGDIQILRYQVNGFDQLTLDQQKM